MTKPEWQRRIADLQERNFKAAWKRIEAGGETRVKSAIQAYKEVFVKEGK